LINGSSGIAVGMATNVPPHNLSEIVDALLALIDDPTLSIAQLMQLVKGPDFPTAGLIYGRSSIVDAYTTGRGILTVRARVETEVDDRTGRMRIVVNEIPYQVNKSKLIEKIAELVNEKRLDGISDLRDESDRQGMRIVIELKKEAIPEVVLNQLYKHTQMQDSFGVIMLAIVDGRPRLLTLKEMLVLFLDHRKEIVTRATAFDLRKAEARLHVLEGLKIALDNLDAIIALIRKAKDAPSAKAQLMERFALSEIQSQAILDMRLQRLTGLERDEIILEHKETTELIEKLRKILSDEREVLKIIATELGAIKSQYGDVRRTEIIDATTEINIEDMIVEEDMVVTVSHEGYIKRSPASLYRQQRRGGKGKTGAQAKGDDFVEHMFVASTHSYILFFSNRGRVYWKKVHELPQAGRAARGKAIVNLLTLGQGEKLSAFLAVREFSEGAYVMFATAGGTVKKTPLTDYSRPRASGIIAISLDSDDELISVRITDGSQQVVLSTRNGMAVRFEESEVRPMGRNAGGVKGAALGKDDRVVSMEIVEPGATLLTISQGGFGKRSPIDDYRLVHRGAKGVFTMKVTEKTGPVVGVLQIRDDNDEMMIVTDGGKLIRSSAADVRVIGRNTQGVRLVSLAPGGEEVVSSVAPVADKDAPAGVEALSEETLGESDEESDEDLDDESDEAED
jgi:DNA gyrase subunit A